MNKEIFNKEKLKVLGAMLAILVGLLFLVTGNPLTPKQPQIINSGIEKSEKDNSTVSSNEYQPNMVSEETYLANKIQQMLSVVEGAGKVKVTVTLSGSSKTQYAINTTTGTKTTQEKDQTGGTRVQKEDNDTDQMVFVRGNNGEEVPVLQQETAANIAGVLVVAEGARDPEIKEELFNAVSIGLGVEPQKILVLSKAR